MLETSNALEDSTSNLFEKISEVTDPTLKAALISAFSELRHYKPSNRSDINSTEQPIKEGLSEEGLLRQIRKEYKRKIYAHSQGECHDQRFIAESVGSTYQEFRKNYPESALPAYCVEMTYLLYDNLCKKGVNPENLLVAGFIANDEDHLILIHSSDKRILEDIREDYLEQKENDEVHEAYENFIDLCSHREESQIHLLDPWSKDNKILDLNQLEQDESFKEVIDNYLGIEVTEAERKEFHLHAFMDGVLQESALTAPNSIIERENISFLVDTVDPDEEMESSEEEGKSLAPPTKCSPEFAKRVQGINRHAECSFWSAAPRREALDSKRPKLSESPPSSSFG